MTASSATKSRSIAFMLVSVSQNGFVLENAGALAGADIGYPYISVDVGGKLGKLGL